MTQQLVRPQSTGARQGLDHDPDWWRQAAVYQVYPRSFADGNGDGIGDLPGLTSRLSYLAGLGVDAIWLSPFYPSPLADGGYDVSDYRDVHPDFGTLADFDELLDRAHGLGMRLIVDIVPNHTSNEHPWFREALAAEPGSPARARYIFRDGTGPDGSEPPSDWVSHFGGPAWTRLPDGQWYCHLFAPEQPDLDWSNREVRDEFCSILRFWADRGVDGFRVDVAHALAKDLSEPLRSKTTVHGMDVALDGSDPLFDRDDLVDIYGEWRAVMDAYDPPRMAVAEFCARPERRYRVALPSSLGQAFNFDLLEADFDAARFRTVIGFCLDEAARTGSSSTWVLSNHDVVRHASRYALPDGTDYDDWLMTGGTRPPADQAVGLRRARAANALMFALPGSSYVYQGDELGLPEVADLAEAELEDPIWLRSGHTKKGRDGCRVPLPWDADQASFGFGAGSSWLPQPDWFAAAAVSVQDGDPDSTLELYRTALLVRRELQSSDQADGALRWLPTDHPDVLHFVRPNGWHCVTNFGTTTVELPAGTIRLATSPLVDGRLPGESTVWLTEDAR